MKTRLTRLLVLALLLLAIAALSVTPAFAHPPCNDVNGDGSPSGQEYGIYHIRMSALNGGMGLGTGGMAPGYMHQGYSICIEP